MSEIHERPVETVGVILVHGIGEQRRFQHLDWQLRDLIRALQQMQQDKDIDDFSVDVAPSSAAAFHAEQDSWTAGPGASVDIVVGHSLRGGRRKTHLRVHEVWWADVNEPYSLAKQFRFWLWGLAIWLHPGKRSADRPSVHRVTPLDMGIGLSLWNHAQLFLVGTFFVLVGYSIGTIGVVVTRLFGLRPSQLRVLANYVSAVKLYTQRRRFGPGVWPHNEEFIDAVDQPPRVSIRRRMIRTIADVAGNKYHRWYILAHSQGSVVAFNGLMETAYAWPGYLDEQRWQRLKSSKLAGRVTRRYAAELPKENHSQKTLPPRPVWVEPNEIVFRDKIFQQFSGFLTYGSPIAKFAGIWPALVPASKEEAFPADTPWINLYDPIDPVSGRLQPLKQHGFNNLSTKCCPTPTDIGYSAGWILLLAHLQYFVARKLPPKPGSKSPVDAALATVHWLLTDCRGAFPTQDQARDCDFHARNKSIWSYGLWRSGAWFADHGRTWWLRTVVAYASWGIAAIILAAVGAVILPFLLSAASSMVSAFWTEARKFAPAVGLTQAANTVEAAAGRLSAWFTEHQGTFVCRMILLATVAVALTAFAGMIARIFFFKRDRDDPQLR